MVQIGAKSDKKMQYEGVIDLTGKLTFKQTAAFFKHCSGFLGLDSGPAYLASWSNTPSIVLMGATQNQTTDKVRTICWSKNQNKSIHYLNPIRPQNNNCSPVPCYVHCLIGKAGGCIIDISTEPQ